MFSKGFSAGLTGLDGYIVSIEADVSDGLPGFSMVGYLSSEVREAQDRVRTALRNSGYRLQAKKITVNLSPADIRKEGTAYDLSIAVAVLGAYGIISTELFKDAVMIGELGLDGTVNRSTVFCPWYRPPGTQDLPSASFRRKMWRKGL